ncbi:NADP-dependent malic enzyme, chloroplastic [Capsicum annuum]|nr:NADP-dependent malic enzyme, chloroplastic [Capsicum annuum]
MQLQCKLGRHLGKDNICVDETAPSLIRDRGFDFGYRENSNNSLSGVSRCLTQSCRRVSAPMVVAAVSSNGKPGDGHVSVLVENALTESPVPVEKETKSTVTGGVGDVYGEDSATEDQSITPWTLSVASGFSLLRNPHYNKGLAFSERERDTHYLRGLLPPVVITHDLQVKKMMNSIRKYDVPLQRYMAMMDLQEMNERLFYKLLIDNVEELLPIVYTPTVGEACQKYGSIFRRPQGLFISLKEKGKIHEVLKNWPEKKIQVIVVTDGERILGLGDLGCQGMGIPVGKLSLYTALGGIRPSACLPVTIDVGTNNMNLLNDEFYIGLRQRRATGQEYAELLDEFMYAVKQNYGEKVLIQFEDFANHNAFDLLAKYGTSHLVFNDDIQGTASVVLAGLMAALNLVGGTLAEHTFLFLGAGEAGTGIAELIALEMSKQTGIPLEETRKKIWMVDSKGLIVKSRMEMLQHFKRPWAHDHEPVKELVNAVKSIKPTVLIGSSGAGRTFTKEVVQAMATFNEKPIIFALSNPTSQSECTAEEAYSWSEGRAIFASGSPFAPVEYKGKVYASGQANNAYIFPGFGLGLIISGAIRVHDDMLLVASEALAEQVSQENFEKGLIYPPFANIRKISAHIAAKVAAKAYELGLATRLPEPKDLIAYAESSWDDLKERFDKINGSRTFNLHKEINSLTQGTSSVFVYFTKFKGLWNEQESLVPPPPCDCVRLRELVTYLQRSVLVLDGVE